MSTPSPGAVDSGCLFPETEGWQQEHLQYRVYYQAGPVWINGGTLNLRMVRDWRQHGAPWHAVAQAASSKRIDRFFPVRDRYETWMAAQTGMPLAFSRDVQEGNYAFQWRYDFDRQNRTVQFNQKRPSGERTGQLEDIPACTGDLFSTLHAIRHLDWTSVAPDSMLPFSLVVDGTLQHLTVRLVERCKIRVQGTEYACLVLQPKMLVGDYFKGKDGLRIWITDDKRRLPVHAKAEILIGALKADLLP